MTNGRPAGRQLETPDDIAMHVGIFLDEDIG
jgi:hypothetical protein